MTDQQQHPIAPPLELVQQWIAEIWHEGTPVQVAQSDLHIATRAAQWGADAELEACWQWANETGWHGAGDELRAIRRPKPPSLKEQALEDLEILIAERARYGMKFKATNIRKALEALPND